LVKKGTGKKCVARKRVTGKKKGDKEGVILSVSEESPPFFL
jgi:hypothetical protein